MKTTMKSHGNKAILCGVVLPDTIRNCHHSNIRKRKYFCNETFMFQGLSSSLPLALPLALAVTLGNTLKEKMISLLGYF